MRARTGLVLVATAATLMAGCTSSSSDGGPSGSPTDAGPAAASTGAGAPMTLKTLVYNVEYGGNAKTDKVIKSLGADVVGVLESYNRLPVIAKNAGYPYYNVGLQLLSKYPILEPSGADGLYALIEVQPGYGVAFVNAHMDYVKYGPKLLREGKSVAAVVSSENEVRLTSMAKLIPDMQELAQQGWPVILTGDFNEPSSLDYTDATVGQHPGVTTAVPWPISTALLDAGMQDAYRSAHPDPVTDPGVTWGFDKKNPGDRIDYTYTSANVEVTSSLVVGKTGAAGVDLGVPGAWTSDHRAVVSQLELTPQALPVGIALDNRMLTKGDSLGVRYRLPEPGDGTVEVQPDSGDAAPTTIPVTGTDGTLTVETDVLDPGGYTVVLTDGTGEQLATNAFWVRPVRPEVVLAVDKKSYEVGEPITVSWKDGPANRWDWIGVYKAGADNPNKDYYTLWAYTGLHDSGVVPPAVSGTATLGQDTQGKPWPLPAGDYVVHYLLTDQYKSVGSVAFTVR